MRARAWRRLAVALVVGGVLAGCGIGENDDPQLLAEENMPCALSDSCGASSTIEPPSAQTETATVYFVERAADEVRLAVIEREITRPADAAALVTALFAQPPIDDERDSGITTSIPDAAQLIDVTDLGDGVWQIDLSEDFETVTGQALQLAYAQLVWTASEDENVDGVVFSVEGQAQSAITGDGTPSDEPVDRSDYTAFRPDRT